MKTYKAFIASAVFISLALALCACSIVTGNPTVSPDISPDISPVASERETLIARFEEAEMAYGWFTGHALVKTDRSDGLKIDQNQYYRVEDEKLQTRSELSAYLCSLFGDKKADELMESTTSEGLQIFSEEDGKLYNLDGYIGQVSYDEGERSFTDIKIDGDNAAFTLELSADPYGDNSLGYLLLLDYTAQRVDGLWQFPDFSLPIIEYIENAPDSREAA